MGVNVRSGQGSPCEIFNLTSVIQKCMNVYLLKTRFCLSFQVKIFTWGQADVSIQKNRLQGGPGHNTQWILCSLNV